MASKSKSVNPNKSMHDSNFGNAAAGQRNASPGGIPLPKTPLRNTGLGASKYGGQDPNVNISMTENVTRKEITYVEEDNSPDYLLPSNGGYNPKKKTEFIEERTEQI